MVARLAEPRLLYQKQVLQNHIEGMVMEDSLSKSLYKLEIVFLKALPFLMAGMYFLNTLLSYFNLDYEVFSYVAGVGLLPLVFLYISSYCFKFCNYHRMPLHYIVVNDVICWTDANFEIPTSDLEYLCVHMIAAFLCLMVGVYLKLRWDKMKKKCIKPI